MLKDVQPAQLAEAIRVIAAGDALLAPSVTRRLLGQFARTLPGPRAAPASLSALTERETEVLRLLAAGGSTAPRGCIWIREVGIRNRGSPAIAPTRSRAAGRPAGTGCPSTRTDAQVSAQAEFLKYRCSWPAAISRQAVLTPARTSRTARRGR